MDCQRDGCSNPVIPPRRKFCSEQCGRMAHRQKNLKLMAAERQILKNLHRDRKVRSCLVCGNEFMSDGPWNRQCPRCKKRAAY
jgi:predicted nucleic acid-binding Zn ribbon protein